MSSTAITAKDVAGRVAVGMPTHVEHVDLVTYGIFGLMDGPHGGAAR